MSMVIRSVLPGRSRLPRLEPLRTPAGGGAAGIGALMQCALASEHAADGVCSYSGKPYQTHELVEVEGRFYAKDNVGKVIAAARQAPAAPAYANLRHRCRSRSDLRSTHALHIVPSLLSCGLWLPIHLIILLSRSC